ncbi:MAG: hypothetical protein K2M83_01285 [Muribaculaceae bacterium]|nr:hypothetical protein [Muribaculaceae bacterium]
MKKIFVCYYRFQEHIGNGDLPVFMSMVMILFATYLYLTGISTGISFFWVNIMDNKAALDLKTLTFCNIVICCLLGGWFYLKHLRGYRLKETLSIEIQLTDKVIATVFVIGSILCLCAVFAFMWAVNNGFILERS